MKPKSRTAMALLGVQQELIALESIFHRADVGISRATFEELIAEEFWEVGASGQLYGRADVLATLGTWNSGSYDDKWTAKDFYCQEIAAENYLFSYTLKQGSRVTRRATIWRYTTYGWVIVFHQGTVVDSP